MPQYQQHKIIFILPMWRALKAAKKLGLLEQLTELAGAEKEKTVIKPPPFVEVIINQPFY